MTIEGFTPNMNQVVSDLDSLVKSPGGLAASMLYAYDAQAANTEVTATLSPGGNSAGSIVAWSYSQNPTGGSLTIKVGSTVVAVFDITSGGIGFLPLDGFVAPDGVSLSATLSAGGSGVLGKLSLTGKYIA